MCECSICNLKFDNYRKLSKHIRDQHKSISLNSYYDTFIKKNYEGVCEICGSITKYQSISNGYSKTCSKSCSAKLSRHLLKQNPEKYEKFITKISQCVENEWKTKDQSKRIKNMKNTLSKKYSLLTEKEKKDRFGYLNKKACEERELIIHNMTNNGFLKWWQTASFEQKRDAWDKRNKKLIILWENFGDELNKKQKETFLKNLSNQDYEKMNDDEMKCFFDRMDAIFNV